MSLHAVSGMDSKIMINGIPVVAIREFSINMEHSVWGVVIKYLYIHSDETHKYLERLLLHPDGERESFDLAISMPDGKVFSGRGRIVEQNYSVPFEGAIEITATIAQAQTGQLQVH